MRLGGGCGGQTALFSRLGVALALDALIGLRRACHHGPGPSDEPMPHAMWFPMMPTFDGEACLKVSACDM
jgi:hypothetical protein